MKKKTSSTSQKSDTCIVFSTPYSAEFYNISEIIHKDLPFLESDPDLAEVLKEGCRMVARKAPTLANVLVQTEHLITQTV